MRNDIQNKDLWQSIMDKTEQEIRTGRFKVQFSRCEPVIEFPKPLIMIQAYRVTVAFAIKSASRLKNKLKKWYKRLLDNQ